MLYSLQATHEKSNYEDLGDHRKHNSITISNSIHQARHRPLSALSTLKKKLGFPMSFQLPLLSIVDECSFFVSQISSTTIYLTSANNAPSLLSEGAVSTARPVYSRTSNSPVASRPKVCNLGNILQVAFWYTEGWLPFYMGGYSKQVNGPDSR